MNWIKCFLIIPYLILLTHLYIYVFASDDVVISHSSTCDQELRQLRLRRIYDYKDLCQNKSIQKGITDSNYLLCLKNSNYIAQKYFLNYVDRCHDHYFQNTLLDPNFKSCANIIKQTEGGLDQNIIELCENKAFQKIVLSKDFSRCNDLHLEFENTQNTFSKCTNLNFLKIFNSTEFNQCLDLKKNYNFKPKKDVLALCGQTSYLKNMSTSNIATCAKHLHSINLEHKIWDFCLQKEKSLIVLSPSYQECIMKLMSHTIENPESKCLDLSFSKTVNSLEFEKCFAILQEIKAHNIFEKCSSSTNLKRIQSTPFKNCIQFISKYNLSKPDGHCLNKSLDTIQARRKFAFCATELDKAGRKTQLEQCFDKHFQKMIESADYLQCKANFKALGVTHLGPFLCTDNKMKQYLFSNPQMICLTQEIKKNKYHDLQTGHLADRKNMDLLNHLFSQCINIYSSQLGSQIEN